MTFWEFFIRKMFLLVKFMNQTNLNELFSIHSFSWCIGHPTKCENLFIYSILFKITTFMSVETCRPTHITYVCAHVCISQRPGVTCSSWSVVPTLSRQHVVPCNTGFAPALHRDSGEQQCLLSYLLDGGVSPRPCFIGNTQVASAHLFLHASLGLHHCSLFASRNGKLLQTCQVQVTPTLADESAETETDSSGKDLDRKPSYSSISSRSSHYPRHAPSTPLLRQKNLRQVSRSRSYDANADKW